MTVPIVKTPQNAPQKGPAHKAAEMLAKAAGGTVVHLGKGRWQVRGIKRPGVATVMLKGQTFLAQKINGSFNPITKTADIWLKELERPETGAHKPIHKNAPPHAAHPQAAPPEAAPPPDPQASWSDPVDFGVFRLRMKPGARGRVLPLNKHAFLVFHVPGQPVVNGVEGDLEAEEVGVLPLLMAASIFKAAKNFGMKAQKPEPTPPKRSWFSIEPPPVPPNLQLEKVPVALAGEVSGWLDAETAREVGLEIGCPGCGGRCGGKS